MLPKGLDTMPEGMGSTLGRGEPYNETQADVRVHRGIWLGHRRRAAVSLNESRRLAKLGFTDPAFVWAVRAVEIFVRECLLFPLYYEELGDLGAAHKRACNVFGSGNWARALDVASKFYGPFDQPLTDADEDAWAHWRRVAVGNRGEVVHGRSTVSREEVEWVQSYGERFMSWWAQRLFVADRGPLRGVLIELIEEIRAGRKEAANDENVTVVSEAEPEAQEETIVDPPPRQEAP